MMFGENDFTTDEGIELIDAKESNVILESKHQLCRICGYGQVTENNRQNQDKSPILLYTRQGTVKAIHLEKRCNNYR